MSAWGEDAHYYSVPCGYIGKKVILLYTSREVCIYYGYELIASPYPQQGPLPVHDPGRAPGFTPSLYHGMEPGQIYT